MRSNPKKFLIELAKVDWAKITEKVNQGPFKCSECEEKEEQTFRCSHCDKKFANSDILQELARIHAPGLPFKCSNCDEEFNSSEPLTDHERIHSTQAFQLSTM